MIFQIVTKKHSACNLQVLGNMNTRQMHDRVAGHHARAKKVVGELEYPWRLHVNWHNQKDVACELPCECRHGICVIMVPHYFRLNAQ